MWKKLGRFYWLAPILILVGLSVPWNVLGSAWDPDETRYLEIAREMVEGGDWLVPTLNGVPYLEKPPLYIWAMAAVFKLAGAGILNGKWISLASAAGVALLTLWLAGMLGSRQTSFLAGMILATSPLFLVLSSIVTIDMFFTFLVTASIAFFVHGLRTSDQKRRRGPAAIWMAYVLLGLAILTKGPVALVVPGLIWICGRPAAGRGSWMPPKFLPGLMILLAVSAPWFALMSFKFPVFLDFFFIRGHLSRLLGQDVPQVGFHVQSIFYYFPVIFGGAYPWALSLIAPGGTLRRDLVGGTGTRLAWSWLVPGLVFFSLAAGKLPTYVLSLFPALALISARRWAEMIEGTYPKAWQLGLGLVLTFTAAAAIGVAAVLYFSPEIHPVLGLLQWRLLAVTGAAVLLGPLIGLVLFRRGNGGKAFAALVLTNAFILASGAFIKVPIDRDFTMQGAALKLRAVIRPEDRVICFARYFPIFSFYLKKPVLILEARGELSFPHEELKARPDLFLELSGLREKLEGSGRFFITAGDRNLPVLEKALGYKLHILECHKSYYLLSNQAEPWPPESR